MTEKFEYLQKSLQRLSDNLKTDTAGHASTMLHYIRKRLEELQAIRQYLFETEEISLEDSDELKAIEKPIEEELHKRLQDRISWLADILDMNKAAREASGQHDVYTTAVILANAFNDILDPEQKFKG